MKSPIRAVLALVAIVALFSTLALARGAPSKEKAFTDQAIVSVQAAPVIASVPPMTTGYDVICNLTTAYPRPANANQFTPDSSERGSRSTTGDERNLQSASTSYSARSGPSLCLVMLA